MCDYLMYKVTSLTSSIQPLFMNAVQNSMGIDSTTSVCAIVVIVQYTDKLQRI